MVRLTGPLFSEKAQKQLGHKLIYKTKGNRSFLTKYNKPGGASPFNPSATQVNQRMIYNLIIANWQVKSAAEKKVFDDLAKKKNLKMSGWNYFVREAVADLPTYLGLQGYWAFNRIVAGKYQDISGNANHGTPKPLYPSNYPQMVDGINRKFGKAGSFDGIDDRVDLAVIPFGGRTGSLAAWAKIDTAVGVHSIIGRFWQHYTIGTEGARVRLWWRNVFKWVDIGAAEIVKLHYYVVTYDGDLLNSNLKLYLDGALIGNWDLAGDLTREDQIWQIGSMGNNGHYWNGKIDEVRIYNRVLPAEEIKKHYDLVS